MGKVADPGRLRLREYVLERHNAPGGDNVAWEVQIGWRPRLRDRGTGLARREGRGAGLRLG